MANIPRGLHLRWGKPLKRVGLDRSGVYLGLRQSSRFTRVNTSPKAALSQWLFPSGANTSAVSDTASFTESFLKRVEKLFSDALSATEGFVKSVNRTVADTVALTENFVASRAVLITGSDTLALTESFAKSANKSVGETLAFTESFLKSAGKSISDSIGLTESLAAAHARLFGGQDSLSITEALTHFLSRAQADTVVLTESLTPLTIPSGGGSGPSSASFVGSAAPSGHAGLFAFSMTASGWWGSSTHTSGGGWIGANTL